MGTNVEKYVGRRSAEMSDRVPPGTIIVQAQRNGPDIITRTPPEVVNFFLDGITYMIWEDKLGTQHIEPDHRGLEVDPENYFGEHRMHREITDPLE